MKKRKTDETNTCLNNKKYREDEDSEQYDKLNYTSHNRDDTVILEIEKELICDICLDIMKLPVMIGCKGVHRFCFNCLTKYSLDKKNKYKKSCPKCHYKIKKKIVDLLIDHSLNSICCAIWNRKKEREMGDDYVYDDSMFKSMEQDIKSNYERLKSETISVLKNNLINIALEKYIKEMDTEQEKGGKNYKPTLCYCEVPLITIEKKNKTGEFTYRGCPLWKPPQPNKEQLHCKFYKKCSILKNVKNDHKDDLLDIVNISEEEEKN